MSLFHPGSSPDVILSLQARGAAGAEIIDRLQVAEQIIAEAAAPTGFTHAAQRHRVRQRGALGRRLLSEAMADATRLLAQPPIALPADRPHAGP
ncbi:hypothetical protein [Marinovum sp.]|uniref:hypothetical protein n=1 Tax=Marinovum sp. TaxID=2024839 RepID=UPI002B27833F|nr:hypothetical protein [Marinovum sp.]